MIWDGIGQWTNSAVCDGESLIGGCWWLSGKTDGSLLFWEHYGIAVHPLTDDQYPGKQSLSHCSKHNPSNTQHQQAICTISVPNTSTCHHCAFYLYIDTQNTKNTLKRQCTSSLLSCVSLNDRHNTLLKSHSATQYFSYLCPGPHMLVTNLIAMHNWLICGTMCFSQNLLDPRPWLVGLDCLSPLHVAGNYLEPGGCSHMLPLGSPQTHNWATKHFHTINSKRSDPHASRIILDE